LQQNQFWERKIEHEKFEGLCCSTSPKSQRNAGAALHSARQDTCYTYGNKGLFGPKLTPFGELDHESKEQKPNDAGSQAQKQDVDLGPRFTS